MDTQMLASLAKEHALTQAEFVCLQKVTDQKRLFKEVIHF